MQASEGLPFRQAKSPEKDKAIYIRRDRWCDAFAAPTVLFLYNHIQNFIGHKDNAARGLTLQPFFNIS